MKLGKFWLWFFMVVSLNEWSCFGCWEEERSALLQLKENINFPDGKSLSSWIVNETAADCCSELSKLEILDFTPYSVNDSDVLPVFHFTFICLFSSCQELHALSNFVELELSYNEVDNFTASEGIKSMFRFETLYLDGIKSKVSNMKQSLTAFSNIKKLYFRYITLEGMLVTYALKHVSQLEGLYLDYSSVDASFLQSIGVMTSLKFLTLSECEINGTLPAQGQLSYAFYNSNSLETLDLRENRFSGNIPQWIGNLSSLRVILLRGNHFEGTIPEQLCQMKRLSMIDLSYNDLSGQIPHCLGNITLEDHLSSPMRSQVSWIWISSTSALSFLVYLWCFALLLFSA
ncbi:unnamed protein product [Fraxinus pennsylvanica]|uniref:Leucine-rich repeat-containing N-terminal plant-type domain-containing protein n=1 Tax=Fraxinus pennsylvanica TaxID=56036 RepID=A0AAD2A2D7_9LAMI|nr:unnamed protein product [Fraxinus pennsylvanica]